MVKNLSHIFSALGKKYDALLPANISNPFDFRKGRVFVFMLLFNTFIGLVFIIASISINDLYEIKLTLIFIVLNALIYFIYKNYNNIFIASNSLALMYSILFGKAALVTGGIYSDNLLWLLAAPLISTLFSRTKYGIIWLGGFVVFACYLYRLDLTSNGYFKKQTTEFDSLYYFITYSGLGIMLVGITLIFASGQHMLVETIGSLREKISIDKKFIKEKLRISEEFIIPFQQYLAFFPEFVMVAKKVKIEFKIEKNDEGIELKVLPSDEVTIEKINEWLGEYISFVKTKIEDIVINSEGNSTKHEIDILVLRLQNEVTHLHNSLNIIRVEKNMLVEQNEFLKNLSIAFVSGLNLKNRNFFDKSKNENLGYSDLKELVANNEVPKVLQFIIENTPSNNNDAILLLSEFQRIQKEKSMNLLSEESFSKSCNQIKFSVLNLIDELRRDL